MKGAGMRLIPGRVVVIPWIFLLCFIFNFGCASVTYERGHPRVYKLEYIKRVAVLPFGNVKFTDEVMERLVNNSKWRVVDQESLGKIMREFGFENSRVFDKDMAVKLGKSAGVDLVIFGEYREDSVVVKAADVATAEYLAYENIDLGDYKGMEFRAAKAATVLVPYRIKLIDGKPNAILCGDAADQKIDE